jgi:hypothetical protein
VTRPDGTHGAPGVPGAPGAVGAAGVPGAAGARGAVWLLALVVTSAAVLGACGPATGPSTPEPLATHGPAPAPSTAAAPTAAAATSTAPRPTLGGGATVLDASLLAILPADVAGAAVEQEAQSFTDAASDPAFAASVEAAVFAVVVDAGDIASGVVARLRPGVYSDAFFRDWRDTYDAGACAQAGGVVGHAEAQLGGRTTYITSCAGGLRTYHAYLDGPGILVSLFSLGERRFGEQIMAALRP